MVRTQGPYRESSGEFGAQTVENTEMDTDFRILEWQQLANESAMKQELMVQPKMTREGVVGTAATDVRAAVKIATNRPIRVAGARKGDWMERVLEEEQQKPLKVSEQFVRKFEAQEAAARERVAMEKRRFRKNVRKMETIRKRNEDQRALTAAARVERKKFEAKEAARVTGREFDEAEFDRAQGQSSGALYEAEEEWDPEVQEASQAGGQQGEPQSWSAGGPSWDADQSPPPAHSPTSLQQNRAPEIQFIKRQTPATGNTPSQIIYAVKVAPRLSQASLPSTPPPKSPGSPPVGKRTRQLRSAVQESDTEARLRAARIEREEKRRAQEERARYQDSVISQWLLEKKSIEQHRKRSADSVKRRERNRMLADRQRIMTMEAQMQQSCLPERPKTSEGLVSSQPTGVSTSVYLQKQRQLLLEDYLRKHMSLPLQARSTVLMGLEELQPSKRATSADPSMGGRG